MARLQTELLAKDATVSSISQYLSARCGSDREIEPRSEDPADHLCEVHGTARVLPGVRAPGSLVRVGLADVREFKWYNDALGHAIGDRIIARVARLLRERARADDLIAKEGSSLAAGAARPLRRRRVLLPDSPSLRESQARAIGDRFCRAVVEYDWTTEDHRLAERPVRVDVGLVCILLGQVQSGAPPPDDSRQPRGPRRRLMYTPNTKRRASLAASGSRSGWRAGDAGIHQAAVRTDSLIHRFNIHCNRRHTHDSPDAWQKCWMATLLMILGGVLISTAPVSAQLGSLVVNMSSPSPGSTVSGTVSVSASVTIVGPSPSRGSISTPTGAHRLDSTAPYSVPWNTTTASNGSYADSGCAGRIRCPLELRPGHGHRFEPAEHLRVLAQQRPDRYDGRDRRREIYRGDGGPIQWRERELYGRFGHLDPATVRVGDTGPITVTTAGGTATSSGSFLVILPPAITSFSPAAVRGDQRHDQRRQLHRRDRGDLQRASASFTVNSSTDHGDGAGRATTDRSA